MVDGWHVLVRNGVVLPTDPGPSSAFLRSAVPGAYTTTRTAFGASHLLLWQRHMARLSDSLQILASTYPGVHPSLAPGDIENLVSRSLTPGLAAALELRRRHEEIAITVLLCPRVREEVIQTSAACDAYVHASSYVPAHEENMPPPISVAVMGPGRTNPGAKYSLWASARQMLEACRPQEATEIILSDDGNSLLEGTLTNFFVVASLNQDTRSGDVRDVVKTGGSDWRHVEVQTAPLKDGVLPGVIRKMVLEVCEECGIPIREIAPSWAQHHTWTEAFVTSSMRILQAVCGVHIPATWTLSIEHLNESSWKRFEFGVGGPVTRNIHKLVLEKSRQQSINVREIMSNRHSIMDFDATTKQGF